MRSVTKEEVEKLDRRAALVFHAMRADRWVSNHDIVKDLHGQCNITIAQVDHYGEELSRSGFCRKRSESGRLHYLRAPMALDAVLTLARGKKEADPMAEKPDDSPEALMERASALVKELTEVHNKMLGLISSLQTRPIASEEEMAILKEKARRFDQFAALTQPIK